MPTAEMPTPSLDEAKTLPRDVPPGAIHWILAVILTATLASSLVWVYRVVRKGQNMHFLRETPEGARPVQCGACMTVQHAIGHGQLFICFSCRAVNRLPPDISILPTPNLVERTGPLRSFEFRKESENFWQELKVETLEEDVALPHAVSPPPSINTVTGADDTIVLGQQLEKGKEAVRSENQERVVGGNELGVSQCVICIDSPGIMVLLPCAHGGVCEECATCIAQNRASGGAHCPHCRSQIQDLVKIHEIEGDMAKGIEYRIPIAEHV